MGCRHFGIGSDLSAIASTRELHPGVKPSIRRLALVISISYLISRGNAILGLGLPHQKIYLSPTTSKIVVYTHVSVNDLVTKVIKNRLNNL